MAFLAARTARSQAYAQAMAAQALQPERTVIFGPRDVGRAAAPVPASGETLPGIFVPDLNECLEETLDRAAWSFSCVEADNVNDSAIESRLAESPAKLVIYSGFGGQIVGRGLLDASAPFLHMHCGWVPDYRGSTTVYYSLLREQQCAVSAILLTADIDTGPIVARRRYPPPPLGLDIDYIYDNALRADLLINVLAEWRETRAFPVISSQSADEGTMYYVIHPVLKHLALLSLGPCG